MFFILSFLFFVYKIIDQEGGKNHAGEGACWHQWKRGGAGERG
jgi:hypothetical protein